MGGLCSTKECTLGAISMRRICWGELTRTGDAPMKFRLPVVMIVALTLTAMGCSSDGDDALATRLRSPP
jgi:hypothetical protein